MVLLCAASLVMLLGIAAAGAGGCMSLGNLKFKKLGNLFSLGGVAGQILGLVLIYVSYRQVLGSSNVERVEPIFPRRIYSVFDIDCSIAGFVTEYTCPVSIGFISLYPCQSVLFLLGKNNCRHCDHCDYHHHDHHDYYRRYGRGIFRRRLGRCGLGRGGCFRLGTLPARTHPGPRAPTKVRARASRQTCR